MIVEQGNHADSSTYVVHGDGVEAHSWVGREVVREAAYPVNAAQIGYFCALVQDPDENHWDPVAATARYGALVAPPGMLMVWQMPLPWHPAGRPAHAPLLALELPLPGSTLINVSTRSRFLAPMRVGDRLRFTERVTALSTQKQTVLGAGHFVTTETVCRRDDGTLVATNENVLLRYTPEPGGPRDVAEPVDSGAGVRSDDERLPSVTMTVTPSLCALDAAATGDFFPGHHDREYARSQGARDAYLNTMFFHGLVDRVGKAWAGPEAWLSARTLRMLAPVCVGDTLRTEGRVVARYEEQGLPTASLAVDVYVRETPVVRSELTVVLDGLPGRARPAR